VESSAPSGEISPAHFFAGPENTLLGAAARDTSRELSSGFRARGGFIGD